jgi:hypothetical protein
MERDANWDKQEWDFQENLVNDNQEHVISVNNGNEQDFPFIICRSALKNKPGIGKESGSLMLGPKYNWQWGKIIVQCLKYTVL